MKKFLFGCALAVSAFQASSASAQDLCCPPQCDPCCYGSGFDGFYIGGNVGALSHTAHRQDLDGFLVDNSGWTTTNTNVTAGLQLGYDWQCCNALFGIVGDWNWVNTRHRLFVEEGTTNNIRSDGRWFSTIRARAGLSVCDVLLYVTAGGAAARFQNRWSDDSEIINDFDFHHTRWGWVGGVGAEFLLGCSWSLGLELLNLHFDDHRRTFTRIDEERVTFSHSDSAWLGRITLNYRFGNLCCF